MVSEKSRIAVLGTIRELHREPLKYDLRALSHIIEERAPDLLCAEIGLKEWEATQLTGVSPEYREVVLPLSRRTSIIVVPIDGGQRSWSDFPPQVPERGVLSELRRRLVSFLNWVLVGLVRLAGSPRAINSGLFEHLCGALCITCLYASGRSSRRIWEQENQSLLEGVLESVRRDPGRRVLVTVDCRRKHWLRKRLRRVPEMETVNIWRL
jgi:hypothetical protein